MKLIVDIDEDTYKDIKKGKVYSSVRDVPQESVLAIANGTPLPKGHGRLIDGDRFDVISYQHTSDEFDNGVMWLAEQIDNAPTIIEADVESEE